MPDQPAVLERLALMGANIHSARSCIQWKIDFGASAEPHRLAEAVVLGLHGDRRDEDIRQSPRVIGQHFDRVIVREDFDRRGRRPGEVPRLIREGLSSGGTEVHQIVERADPAEAIALAASEAQPGDLVVFIADTPDLAADLVEDLRRTVHASERVLQH